MGSTLFSQAPQSSNVIDLRQVHSFRQKDNHAKNKTTKPQVRGNGNHIKGAYLHKRSAAKVGATTYTAHRDPAPSNKADSSPGYIPPPPPIAEPPAIPKPPPPPPIAGLPSASGKTAIQNKPALDKDKSHNAAHLNAIQNGVKLKKVGIEQADEKAEAKLKQTENPIEGITARGILQSASWEKIKMQLGGMIISAQGMPGDNPALNQLMKHHATYCNKEGEYIATNDKGQEVKGLIYKSYVCARDKSVDLLGRKTLDGIQARKNDNNNDFNVNIMSFLDIYLNILSATAKENNSDLFAELNKKFNITPMIESPRQLFENWPVLRDKCKNVGIDADMLIPGDITEEFVDAIMHSEDSPKALKKHMLKVFERQLSGLEKLAKIVDIDLSSIKKQIKRRNQRDVRLLN